MIELSWFKKYLETKAGSMAGSGRPVPWKFVNLSLNRPQFPLPTVCAPIRATASNTFIPLSVNKLTAPATEIVGPGRATSTSFETKPSRLPVGML